MTDETATRPIEIQVRGNGRVRSRDVEHACAALEKVIGPVSDPILSTEAILAHQPNRDPAHQAQAEATFNINGEQLRAHTSAPTMTEAIDALEDLLRSQLRDRADRHRHGPTGRLAPLGQRQRGNLKSKDRPFFDRPVDERELVKHKTFATPIASVEEATWDMSQLDYDFFLFRDEATGNDAVVFVNDDNETVVRPIDDVPLLEVEQAIDWLDNTGERFVFFNDPGTDRGAVVYRRYDGNYGLLTPR